jgi:hypothetical protein
MPFILPSDSLIKPLCQGGAKEAFIRTFNGASLTRSVPTPIPGESVAGIIIGMIIRIERKIKRGSRGSWGKSTRRKEEEKEIKKDN